MRVRMRYDMRGELGDWRAGEIYDVDDALGADLIRLKCADEAAQPDDVRTNQTQTEVDDASSFESGS